MEQQQKRIPRALLVVFFAAVIWILASTVFDISAFAKTPVSYLSPIYVDANDPTKGIKGWETKTITNYTTLKSADSDSRYTNYSGWVVATGNVSRNVSVCCNGDVKLILTDGCNVDICVHNGRGYPAVTVTDDNSLTVYAQSTDKNTMGKLIARSTGESAPISNSSNSRYDVDRVKRINLYTCAGIGGRYESVNSKHLDGKNITINGGYIQATGTQGGPGIGGGASGAKNIVINGGYVEATCENGLGAGIGGGKYFSASGITINGGYVKATSRGGGAGIGGGYGANGENITINGGYVETSLDTTGMGNINSGSAGIGGGCKGEGKNITINGGTVVATGASGTGDIGGAGIGGGSASNGSDIEITGGTVTATGGCNGAGIGGGNNGAGKDITITGGTVTAKGTNGGAGIGGGDKGNGQTITITGGTVVADHVKGNGSAGIGGGCDAAGNDITIENATVYAYAGWQAAGIGGGLHGFYQNVRIRNSYVYAKGSQIGAIGVGLGADGTLCTGGVYVDTNSSIYEDGIYQCRGQGDSVSVNGYTVCGEVEITSSPVATVTDSGGNTTKYYTLQAAYEAAGTNTITLQKDVSLSQLTVAEDRTVTINLHGYKITGDGSGSTIVNNGTLTLYGNGTITGGKAENGGNIYNAGTLKIRMSTVTGGSATNGGNIYNGGTLNIGWIAIITDGAATNGGNIYNAGTLEVTDNADITGGSAVNGGNIYNADTLTLKKCEIADGSATLGGGVYNAGSLTCGANAKIINNNATEGGGGVLNAEDAHCTYTNDNFSGNTAYGSESTIANVYGGAVFEATNYAREDGEDDVGSVFSGSSLWFVIAGGVVIIGGVVAVILIKKHKNKKQTQDKTEE